MSLRCLALLAVLAAASAACPNDCNGNGYCNEYSACNCFRNWQGADCSSQSCPWAHSFVDIPQGDLNADGRLDVPDIYTVTLCSSATMAPADGASYKSYNGDQHTTAGTGTYTTIAIHDDDGTGTSTLWNAGFNIEENIYPGDQFTHTNDPLGVVERCMERDSSLKFGLLVHVRADSDPGLICGPNEWLLDNSDSADVRFTHCTDHNPLTSSPANQPDLLRMATLTPGDGTSAATAFGGNAARDVYVGAWSTMTYVNQGTNDKLWERYPDDHFHAGQSAGIGYGDLTERPIQDDEADMTVAATYFTKNDWDEGHFYAECAAKGLCDRGTGLCQCFPGFTGSGCARTACPDDCSGHGTCQRLVDASDRYLAWDAFKTQQCVCDAGYTGPNCALRICPKGDDPVTRLSTLTLQQYTGSNGGTAGGLDHTGHRTQSAEIQVIGVANYGTLLTGNAEATAGGAGTAGTAPFALEFTDEMGDKWTTRTINFRHATVTSAAVGKLAVAASIENALESLPNNVVPNVEVNTQAIHLPVGCQTNAQSELTCTSYGSAIPSGEWLVSVDVTGTMFAGGTGGVCKADADADCLVVTNGKLTEIRAAGTQQVGLSAGDNFEFVNTDTSSLYAITFVENSGDLPDLGARYQWEFESAVAAASLDRPQNSCDKNTLETVSANCAYSVSTSNGAFDYESVDTTFYMQELFTGDKEEKVCSNRGICDYSTGLCKCFNGFTTHDCSVQNSLATA